MAIVLDFCLEVGEDLKLYQKKAGFVNPYANRASGEVFCLEVGEDLNLYQKKAGFESHYARKRARCEEALCYSMREQEERKPFVRMGAGWTGFFCWDGTARS